MSKKVIIGTLMALAVLTVIVSITSISFIVDAIKSNELSPSPVATSTSAVTTNTLSTWRYCDSKPYTENGSTGSSTRRQNIHHSGIWRERKAQ